MDLLNLSEPARRLLLAMADGKVLTYTVAGMSHRGPTIGHWELDREYIDESGPVELQDNKLIHEFTLSDQRTPQPVSLTFAGVEASQRLRNA